MAKHRRNKVRKSEAVGAHRRSRRNRLSSLQPASLQFESLETKRLLATVTVGNATDVLDGDTSSISALVNNPGADGISLREAILASNNTSGADTITFDASVFIGGAANQIQLSGSELTITESLWIDASALADNVTIDAQQNSRVLNFTESSGDLTLTGLNVTGGRTTGNNDSGGGIRFGSSGNLMLTSCAVDGNSAAGFLAQGGGISTSSGNVSLTGSTVSGNTSGSDGGGISTRSGYVTLTSSRISGNSTLENLADGGGIYVYNGAVALTDSTVSANTSSDDGGGVFSYEAQVTLTDSTVSGNSSSNRGGGVRTASANIYLTGSTVSGNTASNDGGGIRTNRGNVTLDSSTVTNNSANYGGGVFILDTNGNPALIVTDSIIADNTATTSGHDLVPDPDSTFTVNFSLIGVADGLTINGANNLTGTAASPLDPQLAALGHNGGPTQTHALMAGSPAIDAGDPSVTTGFDQRGTPLVRAFDDPDAPGTGRDIGAVERQTLAPSFFVVTTVTDEFDYSNGDVSLREAINTANGSSGADTITFDASVFTGGANSLIRLGGSELVIGNSLTIDASAGGAVDVTVTGDAMGDDTVSSGYITDLSQTAASELNDNSRVLNFSAATGDLSLVGLTVTGGRTAGRFDSGGGIRFDSSGNLAIDQSNISGNSTTGNRAYGGGIHADSGNVALTGSTVSRNQASGFFGGGISTRTGQVTLTDSTISANTVSANSGRGIQGGSYDRGFSCEGGGIFTHSGHVALTGSTVSGNYSEGNGGGITTFFGSVSLTGSTVSGNSAGQLGGGIRADNSGTITLTDSTVSGNTSGSDGGGIYTYSTDITLTGSIVSGNIARDDGGGVFTRLGSVTLNDSTVSANYSQHFGGGVYTSSGDVALTGSTVSDNIGVYGGGIHTSSGIVTLTRSTVSGNIANDLGGGVWTSSGDVTLESSTVSGNSALVYGGGIFTDFGAVDLTNSTVSGNTSSNLGGGISAGSGIVSLDSSTVTDNTADSGGGVFVRNSINDPAFVVTDSIIADNMANSGPDLVPDPDSTLMVNFSLIGVAGGLTINGANNLTGTAASPLGPQLAALGHNGGPTQTHALMAGSPAIDAGDPSVTTGFDQRDAPFVRAFDDPSALGTGRDIGAVERQTLGPSFFVVTTATDELDYSNGDVSLREAINSANGSNGADTITFDASVFTGGANSLIRLGGSELVIGNSLTIDASAGGAVDVTVTGDAMGNDTVSSGYITDLSQTTASELNDNSRVLNFSAASGDLLLVGLTITGGRTTGAIDDGGGIHFGSSGNLALTGSTVEGNSTTGNFADGGGIYADSGNVTLTDSTVSGNRSEESGGGGIGTASGNVTLTDSTVSGNYGDSDGGGIRTSGGDVALTGSSVSGNSSGGDGGGISTSTGTVALAGSTVSGNTAFGTFSDGGGIGTSSGNVTLDSSTVSGNTASGTFSNGGGIRTHGAVTLTRSTVSGNSSTLVGGGIYTERGDVSLIHSTVTANSSGADGGGIFVRDYDYSPSLTIENSIVAGNLAGGSSPDFTPDLSGALTVNFSLIGNNAGTTLAEAQTADANGNLIGSAAGAGIINPLLVPLADNGGPSQTHALLPGSPAIDAGDPAAVAGQNNVPEFDQRGAGFTRTFGRLDMGSFERQTPVCDFDADGDCDIDDIDAMVMEIVAGTSNPLLDVTGDGNVDLADRDKWLADAGALNLSSGNPYLLGDANLDGTVDGSDFLIWNANKFQTTGKWSQGDWNADGVTDGQDFIVWNDNKFQIADVSASGHSESHERLNDMALTSLFDDGEQEDEELGLVD